MDNLRGVNKHSLELNILTPTLHMIPPFLILGQDNGWSVCEIYTLEDGTHSKVIICLLPRPFLRRVLQNMLNVSAGIVKIRMRHWYTRMYPIET
jgi:hypothetical protein